jgi:hypothetical protein
MTGSTVITLHVPHCRYSPARGLVYLALLRCHFPDTLEARFLRQRHKMTRLTTVLQELHKTVFAFTEASCPPQQVQIPIAWRHIKHCALNPAVSSIKAYSTPAQ